MELLCQATNLNNFGLRNYFPWSPRIEGESLVKIDNINHSPEEKAFLYNRLCRQIPDFQRAYIGRIENPYLWSRYVLRYEEMKAQNLTRHVTEQIVIHATSISAAYEIADNNFDWRLVKRHRYGKGVSFARDAGYANQHAKQNEAYIIAGILVAKTSVGHYSIQIPPNDIDTTTNPRHTVFVKYCDSDFYPYYIVY
ncbi:protein mono-ADP-ribosyltransferase PARP12-like isoform X1 [Athalia rosae]|uniref:protein mono-ADP-ribosyltransferase PARP12-like isoform X1 n=1 Tax=Athalia rosae TaxID=37344 RepID=UPI002034A46E|nr:protein mono-ADP-ribosyltransferase PARP12-like isoform X1 [Athalia rosae]XP_048507790.1 protein mono-ADP-ribosyltransferase PARP12-like isoform X1 [Athalia rosae]